jgi:hypothetical protein
MRWVAGWSQGGHAGAPLRGSSLLSNPPPPSLGPSAAPAFLLGVFPKLG